MSSDRKVKVAAVQMSMKVGDRGANIAKATKLICEAAKEGAKIILLPEAVHTEYSCYFKRDTSIYNYAEPVPGPITNAISEKAREHSVYVIAPVYEYAGPGIRYNTAVVINPAGEIIGRHRKTYLGTIKALENLYFKSGSDNPVFHTEYGTVGIVICYERHFPENWRIPVLKGAEVIFVPAATPFSSTPEMWELVLRTRAYENGVFVVAANRWGVEDDVEFAGDCVIVDPRGILIERGGSKGDKVVSALFDLDEVDRVRIERPFLRDLRAETYEILHNCLTAKQ